MIIKYTGENNPGVCRSQSTCEVSMHEVIATDGQHFEGGSLDEAVERLVRAGRAAIKAKHYDQAIEAFNEAKENRPKSAQIAGEAAWATFLSGDLAGAKRQTTDALALARSAQLKAMLLYNLGRIAEKGGKLAEARAHYAKSLALRENRVVRRRLDALRKPPKR